MASVFFVLLLNLVSQEDVVLWRDGWKGEGRKVVARCQKRESKEHESSAQNGWIRSILSETNNGISTPQDVFSILQKGDKSLLRSIRKTSGWDQNVEVVIQQSGIPIQCGCPWHKNVAESNLNWLMLRCGLQQFLYIDGFLFTWRCWRWRSWWWRWTCSSSSSSPWLSTNIIWGRGWGDITDTTEARCRGERWCGHSSWGRWFARNSQLTLR